MRATGLTSLQRREFRDRPAALLSDPGTPPALAAAAAVIAGEPRRVLRELDSADPDARSAPDWADLRTLASALDVNWWPGDMGADHPPGTSHAEQSGVDRTGDDRADLLLAVVSQVQPQLLSIRTVIRASVRVDPASGAEAVPDLSEGIHALLEATAQVDVAVAASLAVELADLYRLGGLDAKAAGYLAWARQAYTSLDDPAGQARCLLVEASPKIGP